MSTHNIYQMNFTESYDSKNILKLKLPKLLEEHCKVLNGNIISEVRVSYAI